MLPPFMLRETRVVFIVKPFDKYFALVYVFEHTNSFPLHIQCANENRGFSSSSGMTKILTAEYRVYFEG